MFTAEYAIDLRSEAYDERIRDAVYASKSDRSATFGIWYGEFDSDHEYKEAVNGMLTALSERGFSNIESYETDSNTHHHRTIISFSWARCPTKADPVVMEGTNLPLYRVSDEDGVFIDTVRIDSPSIANPILRIDLKRLKMDERHYLHGYIYTRIR